MKMTIQREALLEPLQRVSGAVEKRQTLPVLSHVLLSMKGNTLSITATDLEVELVAHVNLESPVDDYEITVPARKLIDIVKALPANSELNLNIEKNRLIVRSGRSRFALSTLPASEFPKIGETQNQISFAVMQDRLKHLLEKTAFAMAQQDVRYYLNGMLFDIQKGGLQVVATDGHRLALTSLEGSFDLPGNSQVIVPRKGVLELMRLLNNEGDEVKVGISPAHIQVMSPDFVFTSKLVDGKFPDFNRVIPKNSDKFVTTEKNSLKQALARAAILCNEKYHGVRVALENNLMRIFANNPEQEEAEEELEVGYGDGDLEVGFNVNYLLDALNSLPDGKIKLALSDANSSVLVEHDEAKDSLYVVMPMRL